MTSDRFEFDLTEFLLDLRCYDKAGDRELWMGKTLAGFRIRVDPKDYDQLPFLYQNMTVYVKKEGKK